MVKINDQFNGNPFTPSTADRSLSGSVQFQAPIVDRIFFLYRMVL